MRDRGRPRVERPEPEASQDQVPLAAHDTPEPVAVQPKPAPGLMRVKVRAGDGGMGVPVGGKTVLLTVAGGFADVDAATMAVLRGFNLIAE